MQVSTSVFRAALCTGRLAAVAGTLFIGACADQPVGPRLAPPNTSPALDRAALQVVVTDPAFGAGCDDGQDDSGAIERALAAARDVSVPSPCTLQINRQILVPSNTYFHGAGLGSRVWITNPQVDRGFYVVHAHDVTIRGLNIFQDRYQPASYVHDRYAIGSLKSRNVEFSDNHIASTGGVMIDKTDGARVLRNHMEGVGGAQRPSGVDYISPAGVLIFGTNEPSQPQVEYSRNVIVTGNVINNYHDGIQWLGGQADPTKFGYDPMRRKAVENVVIEYNTVTNVANGIWGGNGQNITVAHNVVEHCGDVCLDAEGSDNVRFTRNRARWAGFAVLATYYHSTNIEFEYNYAMQDGMGRGFTPADSITPWRGLYRHAGAGENPGTISVTLRGDTLVYQPAPGAARIGIVQKSASHTVEFIQNQFVNTVIDMNANNNGSVNVSGNHFSFTQPTDGRPAILVGNTHRGPNYATQGEAVVDDNIVTSTVWQSSTPAIKVAQWAGWVMANGIRRNSLSGFQWNVEYQNDGAAHHWYIEGNGGKIRATGSATPYLHVAPN